MISLSQKGAIGELIASTYLIQQGYEVFRNVVPSGPADLVAWNPETKEVIFVDVKTVKRYVREDGSTRYHYSKQKLSTGVRLLLVHDGQIVGWGSEEDTGEPVEPFSLSIE